MRSHWEGIWCEKGGGCGTLVWMVRGTAYFAKSLVIVAMGSSHFHWAE